MTRSEYESARLQNDIAWSLVALGAASTITGFVLTPRPPEEPGTEAASSARVNVSVAAGLGGLDLEVTF